MKKIVLAASALPFALALAACGDPVEETTTAAADTATADTAAQATPVSDPATTAPATPAMEDMSAQQLDNSAEVDEEAADRLEDTNPAAADQLEAQAETKQDVRDEKR